MSRLVVVTNIPTPYRLPLFEELASRLAAEGDELKVIFAAAGYERRQWEVELQGHPVRFEILNNRDWSLAGREFALFSYRGLTRALRRARPDAVVVGGFNMATVGLSLLRRWPYVIWSGAIENRHRRVGVPRRWLRRWLVARATGFLAYGSRARDYLLGLGAAPTDIEIAMNTVDIEHFAREVDGHRASKDAATTPHRLLHIGNLTEGKRLDRMLVAMARLRDREPNVVLTLVGDGPCRSALEQQARELGMADRVRFEGFRQQSELPAFLANTDLFVFPSEYDVWGLVLVEAMAAGLPCLSSKEAGATADLVRDGETGYAVDFSDAEAVARRIDSLLDAPAECRALGRRARRFVRSEVTLAAAADAFVRSFRQAVGRSD